MCPAMPAFPIQTLGAEKRTQLLVLAENPELRVPVLLPSSGCMVQRGRLAGLHCEGSLDPHRCSCLSVSERAPQ